MSKIGKLKINVPDNVKIDVGEDNSVVVSGPQGELKSYFDRSVVFNFGNNEVSVDIDKSKISNVKECDAFHGLYRMLLFNMVSGVVDKFEKKLFIVGVGYKASMLNKSALELDLGFSHKIVFILPKEVSCDIVDEKGKGVILLIKGVDKCLVGQIAAKIRDLRPVEVYKGKGVRYYNEKIMFKEKKTVTK